MNLRIGKFFDIPLYLNLLTIPFILLVCSTREFGQLSLAIFCITMFFVVIHEYGHCLVAKYYKWEVFDITILPIGGIAKINFKYDKPGREIVMALAGPATNVFFAIVFGLLSALALYVQNGGLLLLTLVCFLGNTMILLFNLLPIFPMDGGRVLRALLSYKLGHERATWWAVRIGQIGGITLAVVAFYLEIWIAGLILVLVCTLSQNELVHARLVASLYRIRINLATQLDKPELKNADLPELIQALESIQDKELRKKIEPDEILPLLKDLIQSDISI